MIGHSQKVTEEDAMAEKGKSVCEEYVFRKHCGWHLSAFGKRTEMQDEI
jgi:hypothetical protein